VNKEDGMKQSDRDLLVEVIHHEMELRDNAQLDMARLLGDARTRITELEALVNKCAGLAGTYAIKLRVEELETEVRAMRTRITEHDDSIMRISAKP
jgi:hypothetical protein